MKKQNYLLVDEFESLALIKIISLDMKRSDLVTDDFSRPILNEKLRACFNEWNISSYRFFKIEDISKILSKRGLFSGEYKIRISFTDKKVTQKTEDWILKRVDIV